MTPLLDKASLRSRLRDTRGFMIAEQLTSIVFIGLLCVAVGVGLQVAMNSYASITRQAQADALLQQAVEVVSDELTYARRPITRCTSPAPRVTRRRCCNRARLAKTASG